MKITRYYIYEVLTRLSTYNLVITHGNKPKKYSSSKELVEQYIQNLEKERSDHISNIKSEEIDRNLQAFHFNELQQQIFKVIMKNDLTIQQIVLKLNSYLKDEATNPNSLVERYLKIMYNNHLIKRLRKGKSLKYSYYALPISDIKKDVLNIYLINVEKQIQRINEFLSQIESNPASINILNQTIGSILSKFSIETILKILDRLPQEVVTKYREGINQLKDQYINAKKMVENPSKIETDLIRDVK